VALKSTLNVFQLAIQCQQMSHIKNQYKYALNICQLLSGLEWGSTNKKAETEGNENEWCFP